MVNAKNGAKIEKNNMFLDAVVEVNCFEAADAVATTFGILGNLSTEQENALFEKLFDNCVRNQGHY